MAHFFLNLFSNRDHPMLMPITCTSTLWTA